jgi:CheY-like chemotaxis protein
MLPIQKVEMPRANRAPGVSLPAAKADMDDERRKIATLLLVDDDDAEIELTQTLLIDGNRLQCRVLVAHNAREALTWLRDEEIDLMLVDINMPRTDGLKLLQRIRAEKSLDRVVVVMCSSSTHEADIARARDLGASGYLSKPGDFCQLKAIIASSTTLEIVCGESNGHFIVRTS